MRTTGLTDADIEREFDAGSILRTHVMRPTWHFVAPADIRWLLALTGPRIQAANVHYARKLEADGRIAARSRTVLARALEGGRHLTRAELAAALKRARIEAGGQRLAYLVMDAEVCGIVCSGPRRGSQFTYALLDERVPPAPVLERDAALAELARRYVASHGPATVRDFTWWSGLTTRDARNAFALLNADVERLVLDGLEYWLAPGRDVRRPPSPHVYLLPNYDEFGIAYKDRELFLPLRRPGHIPDGYGFPHMLVIDGQVVGCWQRVPGPNALRVDVLAYRPLSRAETRAVHAAGEQYSRFLGRPVTLSLS
jgi:hypothetical protein